jgi:hypothetical protein
MYAVAIALHHAVTVTYEFYSLSFIDKTYFYVSWVFWFVIVSFCFAFIHVFLVGLVELERYEYISKKYHNYSVMKLLQYNNDTR